MDLEYKLVKTEFNSNLLVVEYGENNKLDFDLDSLNNKALCADLFSTINRYLSKLDRITVDEIFNTLNEFYILKSKYMDYSNRNVVKQVEDILTKLSDLFDLDQFKNWLNWNTGEINFPNDLIETFVYDQDLTVTKEKTYTKIEYQNLIANILTMRFFLPVITEVYASVKGVNKHSYYQTFGMLTGTSIINSEELNKLRTYILEIQKSISISGNKQEYYVLLKGLSSDDINEYILSEIIFTKLLFTDYINSKSNVIGFIYQTIKFKTGFSSTDAEVIRGVTGRNDPKKEDTSYYEDYRKTTNISLGNVVEIQHFLSNTHAIINDLNLQEWYNEEEYREELNYTYKLNKCKLSKTQIILLGWFLHKYINPRALYYIENMKIVELLTMASVILWNSGQQFMSILLTSNINENSNYINNVVKFSLSKEELNALEPLYSFFSNSKSMNSSTAKNLIEDSVTQTAKDINSSIWIPNCNVEKLKVYNGNMAIGHLYIPPNLMGQLCTYVVFCNR